MMPDDLAQLRACLAKGAALSAEQGARLRSWQRRSACNDFVCGAVWLLCALLPGGLPWMNVCLALGSGIWLKSAFDRWRASRKAVPQALAQREFLLRAADSLAD